MSHKPALHLRDRAKKAVKDEPMKFNMVLEVTNYAELFNLDPAKILPYEKVN